MVSTPSLRAGDAGIHPMAFARSVLDLPMPDPVGFLRRAPASVPNVLGQLPGRRRDRRPTILVACLAAGGLAAIGVSAWVMRRRAPDRPVQALIEDRAFDEAALDRAADEGMSAPVGDDVPPHSNGELRDPSAIADPT